MRCIKYYVQPLFQLKRAIAVTETIWNIYFVYYCEVSFLWVKSSEYSRLLQVATTLDDCTMHAYLYIHYTNLEQHTTVVRWVFGGRNIIVKLCSLLSVCEGAGSVISVYVTHSSRRYHLQWQGSFQFTNNIYCRSISHSYPNGFLLYYSLLNLLWLYNHYIQIHSLTLATFLLPFTLPPLLFLVIPHLPHRDICRLLYLKRVAYLLGISLSLYVYANHTPIANQASVTSVLTFTFQFINKFF